MIRILRINTDRNTQNSAFERDLSNRFSFVTNVPIGDAHYHFAFTGVGRETLTDSTALPTHPLANGIASVDHHEPSPRGFEVDAWLSTALDTGATPPLRDSIAEVNARDPDELGLIRAIPANELTASLAVRTADVLRGLHEALGLPCTIYSVRHGILGPFALAGYSSSSGHENRVGFTLSFQELRPAQNVDEVLVPAIPRARVQEPPQQASWFLDTSNRARDPGPSQLYTMTNPEFGVNPDQPLADRQHNYLQNHTTGDPSDLMTVEGSLRRVWLMLVPGAQ